MSVKGCVTQIFDMVLRSYRVSFHVVCNGLKFGVVEFLVVYRRPGVQGGEVVLKKFSMEYGEEKWAQHGSLWYS